MYKTMSDIKNYIDFHYAEKHTVFKEFQAVFFISSQIPSVRIFVRLLKKTSTAISTL